VAIREIIDGLQNALVFNERLQRMANDMNRLITRLDRMDQDARQMDRRLVRVETALEIKKLTGGDGG
jgi:hypothetical protein